MFHLCCNTQVLYYIMSPPSFIAKYFSIQCNFLLIHDIFRLCLMVTFLLYGIFSQRICLSDSVLFYSLFHSFCRCSICNDFWTKASKIYFKLIIFIILFKSSESLEKLTALLTSF